MIRLNEYLGSLHSTIFLVTGGTSQTVCLNLNSSYDVLFEENKYLLCFVVILRHWNDTTNQLVPNNCMNHEIIDFFSSQVCHVQEKLLHTKSDFNG